MRRLPVEDGRSLKLHFLDGEKGNAMEQLRTLEGVTYTDEDIQEILADAGYNRIPILDIRMMSPEREKELGAASAALWERVVHNG